MTYLSSTDLSAVRSLAAESAFSLSHRTDLPPQHKIRDQSDETPRARIYTRESNPEPTPKPAPTTEAFATPKGKHHRRPTPTPSLTPEPESAPEPVTEESGYTMIDLRHRRVRWQHTPTDSHGGRREHGYGILIDLDVYRTRALARSSPPLPVRTPLRQPTPYMRRRSKRVRGYTRDLVPDERAEFATLRNTIRRYLDQRDNAGQNRRVA